MMGLLDFFKRNKGKDNNYDKIEDKEGNVQNKNDIDFDETLKVDLAKNEEKDNQLKFGWNEFVLNTNNFYKEVLISKLQNQYGENQLNDLDFKVLEHFNLKYKNGNISQDELDYMKDTDNIPSVLNYVSKEAIRIAQTYGRNESEAKNYIPDISVNDYMENMKSEQSKNAIEEDEIER